jgi:tRNA (guanine-N7-)-methyltransferase
MFASPPLSLEKIFENPNLPVHLDIGSARGRFLLSMAELDKNTNFIGLEIRRVLVDEANRIAKERNLKNLHYEFTNVLVSLKDLLRDFPEGILQTVTINFPDPWFKKKHAKRRMINSQTVPIIASHLAKNGKIFVQTDVDFLAEEIFGEFRKIENLREIKINENPFPVKTEREKAVEAKGKPIYRAMFEKI